MEMRQVPFRIRQYWACTFISIDTHFVQDIINYFFGILQQETFADDTLVIDQEMDFPVASFQDVKLRVLAVCKQLVSEGRTTLIWEGLCEWLAPTFTICSTANEHGSIVVEPIELAADGGVVSAVSCRTQLKSFNSNDMGLHFQRNTIALSEFVLPSFQKLMDARYQHVENSLLSTDACAPKSFVQK